MIGEGLQAIKGATRLLLHDRDGLRFFNNTAIGFWHSFAAIVVIAPLYLFLSELDWKLDGVEVQTPNPVGALLALGTQWAGWPTMMALVARYTGWSARFPLYVIAYNWSNMVALAILVVPGLLFALGVLGGEGALAATFFLQMALLYYEWYVTRSTLTDSGLSAFAVVLGNYVFSSVIVRLFG